MTLLATTDTVPGVRVVTVKGLVQGNAVRARGIGRDITAAFRGVTGGNIPEYSQLLAAARAEATGIMIEAANGLGANAVVGVRYTTSAVMSGASEILAYGTAVVVEDGAS